MATMTRPQPDAHPAVPSPAGTATRATAELGQRMEPPTGRAAHGLWERILRVPLAGKILGANVLIAAAALVATFAAGGGHADDKRLIFIIFSALGFALGVNVLLVMAALRPLRALAEAAEAVRRGDASARVAHSRLADRDFVRVGGTFNRLLDELQAERERLRELAGEVIEAGDRERELLARELHDSSAQRVAAAAMHLGAVINDGSNERVRGRLEPAKHLMDEVLEELRSLAHLMHPRVLDDLGLPPALRTLAREFSRPGIEIDVDSDAPPQRLPREVESMLYRVAQEAVSNAVRHGHAERIEVMLHVTLRAAELVVTDDGCGFDVAAQERKNDGIGLFSMHKRMTLVDGKLEITSREGAGTRVRATVPLPAAPRTEIT